MTFYDRLYERVPDEKYVTMIRKIADDLLEVAYEEAGRTAAGVIRAIW